jgi:5-methyltetrahydropteroyltriglutamate--homocysteine methyltransferase
MLTTVVGNYPKISSVRNGVNLRKAINDEEKGKIDKDQLEVIYKKSIIRAIEDQVGAGVDIVTDGQIRWSDLIWPFANSIDSVHPGGLRRFYDNNVFYRRPQIADLMSRDKNMVVEEFQFAAEHSSRPVKAVICGPISFCDLSDNHYYKSFNNLAEAIAVIIAEEVAALAAAGCEHIQLDEPSLPKFPEKMELAGTLYSKIFSNIDADGGIFIYFNSIKKISEKLMELPIKFIGLDLVSHPDDISALPGLNPRNALISSG